MYRRYDEGGRPLRDVIALADEPAPEGQPEALMREVMAGGKGTRAQPSLEQLRQRSSRELHRLPKEYKAIRSPERYRVDHSDALTALTASLAESVAGSWSSPEA